MSQPKSQAAVGDSFQEAEIAEYLRTHPDFFERHPLLLLGLRLQHRSGGATISLIERQVAVLRERNAQLERQLKDLVAVAKENDALVEKLHRLATGLLAADSPAALLERIETSLREDFLAERALLVLFPQADPALVRDGFVLRLDPDDAALKPFATFLRAGRPRCGVLRDRQKDLFGRDGEVLGSAAMVPLGPLTEAGHPEGGFLIIGNRDPEHFHPGKRMDFLSRLGELITVALFPAPAR
ncbi:MAG TPA: DUF484 family protein [Gammaproteobacteria bacterium]